MSPFLSLHSVHTYKQSRQFQGVLIVLRLLIAAMLGYQVHQTSDFSQLFIDQNIYGFLIGYMALTLVGYLTLLLKPTWSLSFYYGPVLDWIFALSLLFLLPDQASIAIIIAILFIMAVLHDLKPSVLIFLLASYGLAACGAGWYFNTLTTSELQTAHVIAAILFILAYLYYFKTYFLTHHTDLAPQTGHLVLQKRHLIDGLTYLYPYHQRNHIPLSLLLIRIEGSTRQQKTFARQLATAYKKRLRKCDLLVQINPQHLAILLCDTSASQSSHLVKALMRIKQGLEQPKFHLTYGVCALPFEQEISLEDILQQMINTLNQAEHQKVERLVFINAKQSD